MSFKKMIIVLILITVLSFLITTIAIIRHNLNSKKAIKNEPVVQETYKPVTTVAKKSNEELYLTYHRNVKDNASSITTKFYYDTNSLKWDIKTYEDDKSLIYYTQFTGLLNKDIEASVNKRIKESALRYNQDLQTKYSKSNESQFLSFVVTTDGKIVSKQAVSASFGNVISIVNYSNTYGDLTFCNYDLNTGKDLKFEEMFTSNTDIKQVVTRAFIKKLGDFNTVEYYKNDAYYDDETGEMVEYGYGDAYFKEIDVRTLEKAVKRFFTTDKINFGFTDNKLVFNFFVNDSLNNIFYIDYNDYLNNIAIFSRFNSKTSIFESDKYSVKRVRALYDLGSFNTVRDSKTLIEDNGVIVNYVIRLNSGNCTFDEYNILAEQLTKLIQKRIEKDVNGIRENNVTDKVPVFNGCFRINVFKVDSESFGNSYEDGDISSKYFEKGRIFASIVYEPEVYVVSREEANTLVNSEKVKISYTGYDYSGYLNIATWYFDGNDYSNIVDINEEYYPYYTEVASDIFIQSSSNNYSVKNDRFFVQNGSEARELSGNDLLKYLLSDKSKYNTVIDEAFEKTKSDIENSGWIENKEEKLQNLSKDNYDIRTSSYDSTLVIQFKTGRGTDDFVSQSLRISSDYPYRFPFIRRDE